MRNSFIALDFPFGIICASYQIYRQHPWIRKTILQKLSSAPAPTHIIPRCFFQDMYHIIFLFGKIYLSILALISVCTGRSYYVTTKRVHVVVSILTSKMKTLRNNCGYVWSYLQERRSFSNLLGKCVHIP